MKATGFDLTRRPSAGRVLAVATAAPALALAGWLLAGLPLLLLGWFAPLPAFLLGVPLAAALCLAGLRRLPAAVEAGAWQTASVLAIALASAVFNALFHSEQLVVRRDPATYAQYAAWLARHGSLPIPYGEAAFGGPDPGLVFASVGFYDFDGAVVPQFMPGPALLFAIGHWLGGVPGLLLVPPVLGGLAVLTVAGVAARLAGARWAPLAAALVAVSLPILYTSRTTFSEIPSLIMIFGGMALLLDARERLRAAALGINLLPVTPGLGAGRAPTPGLGEALATPGPEAGEALVTPGLEAGRASATPDERQVRRRVARMRAALAAAGAAQSGGAAVTAALAGLCLGLATLIRIDGLRDVLPVVAYAGLLIALRRMPGLAGRAPIGDGRLGLPLLGGVTAGVALGFLAAQILARPYLAYLRGSVIPLLAICAAVLALTAAGAALAPRLARLAPSPPARLPELAAGLALLVMLAFAVRPLLQTVRRDPATPEDALTAEFVGAIQRANGLPADPTRLYSEQSLYWVIWYVGVPVALLAALAVVVLTRRLARGTGFGWLLPLGVIGWTTVTTLALPAITPDHPFASRRLVPVIIPGMVLLGVWGLRWLRDKARRMGYGAAPQRAVVLAGAALALAFPVYISAGTAFTPVERGEAAAVARLCAAIPPDASVLIVERVTGDRFTQLVRGVCGVPAARAAIPAATPGNPGDRVATTTERDGDEAPSAEVTRLIDRIRATGRRPVLLAAEAAQLTPYSARPRHVLHLSTRQDERTLVSPPDATWSLTTNVWLAAP